MPHSHSEKRMGRPVASSAFRMRAYRVCRWHHTAMPPQTSFTHSSEGTKLDKPSHRTSPRRSCHTCPRRQTTFDPHALTSILQGLSTFLRSSNHREPEGGVPIESWHSLEVVDAPVGEGLRVHALVVQRRGVLLARDRTSARVLPTSNNHTRTDQRQIRPRGDPDLLCKRQTRTPHGAHSSDGSIPPPRVSRPV
jgi:hypothetical protein